MKRTLLFVLMLAVVAGAWAAPKTMNLIFMATGPLKFMPGQDSAGFESLDKKLVADWEKANPGVKVSVQYRDVTQGMLSFQTLLAAGTPPDVWLEAAGNANPYLHDAYAIDFKQYLTKTQLAVYKTESIAPYIRNGNYYALPEAQVAGGFAVNLDMLVQIGEKMPAQAAWTTDEFYRIAKKLKAAGIPALVFFTKNGFSGWDMLWLSAFGGQMYKGTDYSKVVVNTPQSAAALKWMKKLVDEGLVAAPPNEMTDDDSIELFTTGKLFSGIMQNGHSDYWVPEQVKAGKLAKEFAMTFVELPHAPALKHAPTFGYQTIVVAHRAVSDAKNKAIVKLAYEIAAGKDYVYAGCVTAGGFTTRTDVEPKGGVTEKPSYAAIAALAKVAGLQDLNPFGPKSREVNSLWKEPIQAFFRGEISAEKVLADFEAAANEVLEKVKTWAALLMLLPAIASFALCFAVPMVMVGRLALLDSDYLLERFVGGGNFRELARDTRFLRSFFNVFLYLVPLVPYTVILCYGTASMLSRFSLKAQAVGRFVSYLPSLTSGLVLALLWRWLLSRDGLVNQYLVAGGLGAVGWFTGPWTARAAMLLVSMSSGPGALVILSSASIASIPKELHDQAMVDGASESQYRRLIVRPMMTPMIALIVLLCIVGTMQVWETVYVLTGDGGPKGATATPVYDLFRTAFIFNRPGYAAAKGIVLLAVIGALVYVKQRVERWAGAET